MSRLRFRRPRHATIVAYLALFIAIGGSSYAAMTVHSEDVPKNELTGSDIKNLTINDLKGQQLPLQIVTGPKVTVGSSGAAFGAVACPDGLATGGGYSGGIAGHVSSSLPVPSGGWAVQVEGAPEGATFTTYAVCGQ